MNSVFKLIGEDLTDDFFGDFFKNYADLKKTVSKNLVRLGQIEKVFFLFQLTDVITARYAFTPKVSSSLFRLFANAHHSVDDNEHVRLAQYGY